MLRKLIDLQYARNDIDFKRATFRVRGDVVELHPSYEEFAYRIEFFGDEITNIDADQSPHRRTAQKRGADLHLPGRSLRHARRPRADGACNPSARNWIMQVMHLRGQGKLLEAQRLLARTKYDLEMMLEVGYLLAASKTTAGISTAASPAKSRTR